ncbi:hypothetical protein [Nocardia wallacei]|uniref:hypothetical protein n=1 Tax=Nocardia wallacei TaxID=480035 RepID=UPI00245666DC|nr:hypothetical protein [Nocardia wallacei]
MTNPTPGPAQYTRAADLVPTGDPDCPVQIGDEVTPRHAPHMTARVVYVHTDDDVLTTCFVETPDGIRYLTYPWRLVPADPAADAADWQLRMDRFREIQRDGVLHRLQQRQLQTVTHLTALARQVEVIAAAVRTGDLPGTAVIDDEPWRTEFTAASLDDEIRGLAEYRETVLEAELFTAEELQLHLAHPPAPPALAEDTGRATTDTGRWLADLHGKRREERELYRTLCAEYGLDAAAETDHRTDPEFGPAYAQRRDELRAVIADAAGQLIDAIEAGGPLPAPWTPTGARS